MSFPPDALPALSEVCGRHAFSMHPAVEGHPFHKHIFVYKSNGKSKSNKHYSTKMSKIHFYGLKSVLLLHFYGLKNVNKIRFYGSKSVKTVMFSYCFRLSNPKK